jgi:hypothetical protein
MASTTRRASNVPPPVSTTSTNGPLTSGFWQLLNPMQPVPCWCSSSTKQTNAGSVAPGQSWQVSEEVWAGEVGASRVSNQQQAAWPNQRRPARTEWWALSGIARSRRICMPAKTVGDGLEAVNDDGVAGGPGLLWHESGSLSATALTSASLSTPGA